MTGLILPEKYRAMLEGGAMGRMVATPFGKEVSTPEHILTHAAPLAFRFGLNARGPMVDAAKNAAILNDAADTGAAYASGAIAGLVHDAATGKRLSHALNLAYHELGTVKGELPTQLRAAFRVASAAAISRPFNAGTMNKLASVLDIKNPSAAVPIWAQTVYALTSVVAGGGICRRGSFTELFKSTIELAAGHNGDRVAVATIVGQVMGAAWGPKVLPPEWAPAVKLRA